MKRYRCLLCSYVYDPVKGDPENGVDPGTAFEDVPDSWVCPECGAGKNEFEPEDRFEKI
jgi:rubredoxin